jgi:hypothetical protein
MSVTMANFGISSFMQCNFHSVSFLPKQMPGNKVLYIHRFFAASTAFKL